MGHFQGLIFYHIRVQAEVQTAAKDCHGGHMESETKCWVLMLINTSVCA